MSSEFWTEQPSLFVISDADILLAIDDTDNTSKQFTASVLRPLMQTPWEQSINADSQNLTGLQHLIYTPSATPIADTSFGIRADTSGNESLILQVGSDLSDFSLKFAANDDVYNFTLSTFTAPNITINTALLLNDATEDPDTNGEFTRNGTDVKVFSGGAVKNLSNIVLTNISNDFTVIQQFNAGFKFDDDDTSITQSASDLLYDVATGGAHQIRVDDVVEYEFNATQADFKGNNITNVGTILADTFDVRNITRK